VGNLPTAAQLKDWQYNVNAITLFIHESIKKFLDGFHLRRAPPDGHGDFGRLRRFSDFLINDGERYFQPKARRKKQTYRLIGKNADDLRRSLTGTRWACPYIYPDNDLSYPGNFLNMLFRTSENAFTGRTPTLGAGRWRFCLSCNADHETGTARRIRVRGVGKLSCGSLFPRRRPANCGRFIRPRCMAGPNEEVVRMLHEIGSVQKVARVYQAGEGRERRS